MYSISLFHPFWTGGKPEWFTLQPIPLYFFIVPLLSFGGLVLNRRNREVLFFGLVSLLGIFLAKQSGEPFTRFYFYLFTNLPGFSAFREASKFYFLIAIGYAVLTGSMISWINKYQSINANIRFVKYLVWAVIFTLTAWNAKPLITGEIKTLYVKRQVPNDYIQLRDYISADKVFSRVLWVPTDVPWELNTDKHPVIGISSLLSNEWKEYATIRPIAFKINDFLSGEYFHQLISNASIRYLVVPLNDVTNDGAFYQSYGGSSMLFIKQLDKLPFLKRINIGMSDSVLYENTEFNPHLYITKTDESLIGSTSFSSLDNAERNRSEYHFTIRNLSYPVHLNFTDAFQLNWRIYYGFFRWWDVLSEEPNDKPNFNHMRTVGGLNIFIIDPLYIKRNYSSAAYKENMDGSIDVDITLYYGPQSYLNLGLLISLMTLICCIAYLIINYIGSRRKNAYGFGVA